MVLSDCAVCDLRFDKSQVSYQWDRLEFGSVIYFWKFQLIRFWKKFASRYIHPNQGGKFTPPQFRRSRIVIYVDESKYGLTLNKLVQKLLRRFLLLLGVLNNILKILENPAMQTDFFLCIAFKMAAIIKNSLCLNER